MTAPVRTGRVALVEDDDDLRVSTTQLLTLAGFDVVAFPAAPPALLAIDADFDGIVVTDVRMPQMSGIELFRTLRERDPTLPVVLVTGHADVETAVETIKAGAWDFLSKPFDPDALIAAATRAMAARTLALENRRLRTEAAGGGAVALVGRSPAIARLRDMIPVLADTDIDLLIEGRRAPARNCWHARSTAPGAGRGIASYRSPAGRCRGRRSRTNCSRSWATAASPGRNAARCSSTISTRRRAGCRAG